MASYKRRVEILLVEDNPGDIELIREALQREGQGAHLYVAEDGQQALDYLFRRNGHAAAVRPDLVLLDLTLPKANGREVLGQIKNNPGLATIPVVVLTGSQAPEDIADAAGLHANCYVSKPTGLEDSMRALQSILRFWLQVARLP